MTTKLEIIRAGLTLDLDDNINYRHMANDGFGIAQSHRFRDRGPQQHGSTDRGYLLDDRLIQLIILARGSDLETLFDKRDELIDYFSPGDDTLMLDFTRPDGTVRRIDCFTEGAIPFTSNDIIGGHSQRIAIRLWCPDPTWYDPAGENHVFETGAGSDLRRYTLRLDGFVSAHASMKGGELITKPLKFAGRELHLNIATSATGGALVEIQQPDGTPIPGFGLADCHEVFGDSVDRLVTWKGDRTLADLAAQPIRLRFVLKDANLYAFQFAE